MNFVKITDYFEKLDLKVQNHQTYYIESIEECLNEANYYDGWNAYKIFDGDDLVAFAMYGQFPEENNRVYLDRFFIDEKFQGKGYFRKIMPLIVEKIANEYKINELFASIYKENEVATNLFLEHGFVMNGEKDLNGELGMTLKIK